MCAYGLDVDGQTAGRRCYVHRRTSWHSVEQAADDAVSKDQVLTEIDKRTMPLPPADPADDGIRPGDYRHRATVATTTSIYARPGDGPQPWHPRSPRQSSLWLVGRIAPLAVTTRIQARPRISVAA